MGHLQRYLIEHPGFIWLFGFPVHLDPTVACGFNAHASLPSRQHLNLMLRHMPNVLCSSCWPTVCNPSPLT